MGENPQGRYPFLRRRGWGRLRRRGSGTELLWGRLRSDVFLHPQGELRTGRQVELVEDILDVPLGGPLGDRELGRDLPIRHAAGNQDRDLALAGGQALVWS